MVDYLNEDELYNIMRNFASPIVALSTVYEGEANIMITNSVLRATLLPSSPRLITLIAKYNYTHDMVRKGKVLCLNILRREQMPLVKVFGFYSAREVNKLKEVNYITKVTGSPILGDSYAYLDCKVINAMDTGASTVFLVDALDGGMLAGGEIMTSEHFRQHMPKEWEGMYNELYIRAQQLSSALKDQIEYTAWSP